MWTKQEQELLLEEVGQRWTSLLELQEQSFVSENDDSQFSIPNNFQFIVQKCNKVEKLFHILDSNDDLSFHYKNPSDYSLLITIVEELDSEMKERILQKIKRERDKKMFTKDALEYLRKKFLCMKKEKEECMFSFDVQDVEIVLNYVYYRDNYDELTDEDILHAMSKHDYSDEELIQDFDEDLLKLYREVC